ncbi:MAG: hypothetical protein AMXMBFR64_31460 [Myxococcales bacterium]
MGAQASSRSDDMTARPCISAAEARRLFLGAQALLEPHGGDLLGLVERLGFVQLDSIRVVAHAHDLTLLARRPSYRPAELAALTESQRSLFEGFTHDASLIPTRWYGWWKPRFMRDDARIRANAWWRSLLGDSCDAVCEHVLERIEREGPLGSADFEHPEKRGTWWSWKPQKAALDYLWRIGRLAVSGRVGFHKRYDLPERVLPAAHAAPAPDLRAWTEWACATAAERLAVFTPRELAGYFAHVDTATARRWCERAAAEERVVPVVVEAADGSAPQEAFATAEWQETWRALPEPAPGMRLLSPFDPILRDRDRALRRFAFDYRFEAFTPAPKRRYGYYVMPLLEGDRLVGRLDAKLHRARRVLEVKALHWEPGVKATKARRAALRGALERVAAFGGARDLEGPGV